MSINDTGAECSGCGSYNCQYLCGGCMFELLLALGYKEHQAITILREKDVYLENYQIEEVRQKIEERKESNKPRQSQ